MPASLTLTVQSDNPFASVSTKMAACGEFAGRTSRTLGFVSTREVYQTGIVIQYRRMLHIVWEFRINSRKRKQFEAHYSANGTWAKLFRKSLDYEETILIRDLETPDRYLTIDIWKDLRSFKRFKREFHTDYESIDKKCEGFTIEERCIGYFNSL